jgi:hypothetical protein
MKNPLLVFLAAGLIVSIGFNVWQFTTNQKQDRDITTSQALSALLQNQLERAQSQIAQLTPLATRAVTIPISVSTRKALAGSGLVLVFKNNGGKLLTLNIRCTNPAFNTSKVFRLDVNPGMASELGHLQGWAAASGDEVEIACEGYEKQSLKIP